MTGSCGCGRRWTGNAEAHCRTCHEHFTSDGAFDRHLSDPDSKAENCFPPETLEDRNGLPALVVTQRKDGPAWMKRDDREHPFASSNVGAFPGASRTSSASPSEKTPSETQVVA